MSVTPTFQSAQGDRKTGFTRLRSMGREQVRKQQETSQEPASPHSLFPLPPNRHSKPRFQRRFYLSFRLALSLDQTLQLSFDGEISRALS